MKINVPYVQQSEETSLVVYSLNILGLYFSHTQSTHRLQASSAGSLNWTDSRHDDLASYTIFHHGTTFMIRERKREREREREKERKKEKREGERERGRLFRRTNFILYELSEMNANISRRYIIILYRMSLHSTVQFLNFCEIEHRIMT